MKEIKKIKDGANYTAVSTGKFDELRDYILPMGPDVTVNGKVFTGQALGLTGMEMSLQTFAPGEGSPFAHAHKRHEELYMVISGDGQFCVDSDVFGIAEGSLVRVSPAGRRAMRNTGERPLVVMCMQYMADSFGSEDTPAADGIIMEGKPFAE